MFINTCCRVASRIQIHAATPEISYQTLKQDRAPEICSREFQQTGMVQISKSKLKQCRRNFQSHVHWIAAFSINLSRTLYSWADTSFNASRKVIADLVLIHYLDYEIVVLTAEKKIFPSGTCRVVGMSAGVASCVA